MSGTKIKLHDGTTYEDSTCGYADGFLWCYINGLSMAQVANKFFDPAATDQIVFEYGEMSDTYEGFTFVRFMQATETGCSICLTKPE